MVQIIPVSINHYIPKKLWNVITYSCSHRRQNMGLKEYPGGITEPKTWWRHQMKTFSALLDLCEGNSPVTGEFPSQRPVTRSFDVSFDLRLNKRWSKPSRRRWFEMPSCSLWRHWNVRRSKPSNRHTVAECHTFKLERKSRLQVPERTRENTCSSFHPIKYTCKLSLPTSDKRNCLWKWPSKLGPNHFLNTNTAKLR